MDDVYVGGILHDMERSSFQMYTRICSAKSILSAQIRVSPPLRSKTSQPA